MKVFGLHRLNLSVSSTRRTVARSSLWAAALAVLLMSVLVPAVSWAQGSPPAGSAPPRRGQGVPDQPYAPVGQSGYKVYIPEVRMKSIVGERPKKEAPLQQETEPGPKPAPPEAGPPAPPPQEAPLVQPSARLPFEPPERAPSRARPSMLVPREGPRQDSSPGPVPEPPAPPETQRAPVVESPHTEPAREPEQPVESPASVLPPPQTHPAEPAIESPQPPAAGPVVPRVEVLPEQPVQQPQTLVTVPRGKPAVREPLRALTAPSAPEESLLISPTPPRKERLPRAAPSKPPLLLGNQPVKGKGKVTPLPSVEVDDMADPRTWVQLTPRHEAEVIPEPEPAAVAKLEPQQPPSPAPVKLPEPPPVSQPPAEPAPKPTPTERPASERVPEREAVPVPEPRPPKREPQPEPQPMRPPEPPPPAVEQPSETVPERVPENVPEKPARPEPVPVAALPPREVIPSPLDEDALSHSEVAEYLRSTAPILEELAQLMVKGPSLSIADYDPSDPNAPAVPRDLHVQMDSLKRELQILDSKTFAVIPPKKFAAFHDLIRESIAHTYQACDAVIAYLTESNPENLKKVQDHLLKARELIQRTRDRSARG